MLRAEISRNGGTTVTAGSGAATNAAPPPKQAGPGYLSYESVVVVSARPEVHYLHGDAKVVIGQAAPRIDNGVLALGHRDVGRSDQRDGGARRCNRSRNSSCLQREFLLMRIGQALDDSGTASQYVNGGCGRYVSDRQSPFPSGLDEMLLRKRVAVGVPSAMRWATAV